MLHFSPFKLHASLFTTHFNKIYLEMGAAIPDAETRTPSNSHTEREVAMPFRFLDLSAGMHAYKPQRQNISNTR
jgi:hypothetical protein